MKTNSPALTKKTSHTPSLLLHKRLRSSFAPSVGRRRYCQQPLVAALIYIQYITIDFSVEAGAALISGDWLSRRDGWNKASKQTQCSLARLFFPEARARIRLCLADDGQGTSLSLSPRTVNSRAFRPVSPLYFRSDGVERGRKAAPESLATLIKSSSLGMSQDSALRNQVGTSPLNNSTALVCIL